MNCNKFEDFLNDQLDLATLKVHMESCEDCRKAYQVDTRIMDRSKKLNENLSIPDLWPSIEKGIQKKKPVMLKFRARKRLLLAAAASFLILTTFWMFISDQKETSTERILSQQALEKVRDAEEKYLAAISGLEELAHQQLDNTTEPLAQLYRNKLSLIDRQIQNCQQALETNPANSHIRRYLMAALQDKQKTLENILQLSS
jgi:hypothetical protein